MATKAKPKPKPKTSDVYNTATSDIGPNQPYSTQVAGQILGQSAQGIASGQLNEATALEQAGLTPGAIAEGAANLTSNAAYQYDSALGNFESIGLQGQSLATQIGTAAKQQGVETSQYQNQLAQLGLSGQGIASQQGYLGTEESQSQQGAALSQAQIANQQQQLAYETPLALQAQAGQAAASGASNTVGNKNALGNIQEQANTQSTQLGLESQQATLAEQQAESGFQQQGAQLGFSAQQNSLQQQLAGLGQQSELLGYQGQQAQYGNAQQQLALGAQQAGIPAQQATSQLSYGLGQLGIQYDPTSFLSQAATAEGSTAGAYGAALSAASVAGGLSPQSFATKG